MIILWISLVPSKIVKILDGFAYADSYEDGRFSGLTVKAPSAARQDGLLVDPKIALEQIEKDTKPPEGIAGDGGGKSSETGGFAGTSEGGTGAVRPATAARHRPSPRDSKPRRT